MRLSIAALAAVLLIPTVAARGGMPTPLTPRGQTIESIYYQIFIAGTVVFLFVMAWLLTAMWKYRANGGSGRETYELERENLKLEMAWIVVPLIVVLWVGVISYAGLVKLDEGIDDEDIFMEVKITGFQWTWLAEYGSGVSLFSDPDGTTGSVADANVFKVPANVPIKFNITAGDVIHAFHLMDKNWATVGLVDANPYGPHKYTQITVELPLGEYHVQCREMCFNPGHGYMQARVEAVSMGAFADWMEGQALGNVQLPQHVDATLGPNGFADAGELVFVTGEGSRAIATIDNTDTSDRQVTIPGLTLLSATYERNGSTVQVSESQTVTIPAGQSLRFGFDLEQPGDFQLVSGTDTLAFKVIEAEAIAIELGDYFINPPKFTMQEGTTYLLQIRNVGAQGHNIFIGEEIDGATAIWKSATISGGQTTSLLVTPTQRMTFESWCNVPGHVGLGMVGKVDVA